MATDSRALAQLEFDYTAHEVAATDAKSLERHAKVICETQEKVRRATAEGVLRVGKELAEARDRLANHGNGTFGKWCQERCGITSRTAQYSIRAFEQFKDREMISQSFDATSLYLLSHKKSKREASGAKKGTVERKDTDRKQKRGDAIQPGEKRLMKKIGSRISVQFVSGLPEIGNASFNDDGTLISLSLKHPYVEWARDHDDTNALTALAATVLAIESASITDEKQRQRLLPEIDASNQRDAFLYGLSLYTSQMSVEV